MTTNIEVTYAEMLERAAYLAELEKDAPHGRCSLCNLALESMDIEMTGGRNMHMNCFNDFYAE